jgi:hypothetical protein
MKMLTDEGFYAARKTETLQEAARWSSGAMARRMIEAYEKLLAR